MEDTGRPGRPMVYGACVTSGVFGSILMSDKVD